MKKTWSAALAVFVTSAMLATTAVAQTGGGGAGSGAGAAGGGAAGASGASGTGSGTGNATGGSAASTPSPATGQDKSISDSPAGKGTMSSPSASPSTAPHTMGTSTASADYMGRHTMEGEVTKIDHKKGTMTLKTDAGALDLHFPPPAVQNINKGDRVSVELALKPSGTASRGGSAPSASPKTDTGSGSTKSGKY